MPRRKPRRPVFYISFSLRDGASVACLPDRKPTKNRMKMEGTRIDADSVFREIHYACSELRKWPEDQRIRSAELLANRLNMRRTVRDLILPRLSETESTLASLRAQLDRIEHAITALAKRPSD